MSSSLPPGGPPADPRVPSAHAAAVLAELAHVSPYFAVTTGPVDGDDWRPVQQLYREPALVADLVENVRMRIAAPNRLVAVSTLFLGFAARLWSVGIGALAGYRLVYDLAPEQLCYAHSGGQVRLHLARPAARRGGDLESTLLATVVDAHLAPLSAALRGLGPISEKLLRGNSASAALGAAGVFDRHRGAGRGGPGRRLARSLCADERLSGAVRFNDLATDYRRRSCCLYYRTPGGGLCGDCVLTNKPDRKEP
jgi:iron complex transport system ATP-binding protein